LSANHRFWNDKDVLMAIRQSEDQRVSERAAARLREDEDLVDIEYVGDDMDID
jgi:hypothetical protein